jgi:hypothetical protein
MRVRSRDDRQSARKSQCSHAWHRSALEQPASKIFFQVIPGLTGTGHIGKQEVVSATVANVIRVLWPNSSGAFRMHSFSNPSGMMMC